MAPAAAAERVATRLRESTYRWPPGEQRVGAAVLSAADFALCAAVTQPLRPAAVLVGLIRAYPESPLESGGIQLIVRSEHLRRHAGQVAFPGGLIEPHDESVAVAALREAQEEIGLLPADATILGTLPEQLVLTGFRITPVVAQLPAHFQARSADAEVAQTFVLPWSVLLDASHHPLITRRIAGREHQVRDICHGDLRICGATAGILFALRELALS